MTNKRTRVHLWRWSLGADKGIGLETVRRLAGAGYRVYLTPGCPTGTFTGRDGTVPW